MGIRIEIEAESAVLAQREMERLLYGRARPATVEDVKRTTEAVLDDSAGEIDRAPSTEAPTTPEPAEEAPKRRGRPRKTEAAAPAPEQPAQAISTDPENRVDPEAEEEPDVENGSDDSEPDDAPEDDDLIGGFTVTGEGLMAAMQAHATKFGLEETQKHGSALFGNGFTKRSDVVAAGDDAIRAALGRFVSAIETGKAGG